MSDLTERIQSAAAESARPGQYDRLLAIAEEVGEVEAQLDRLRRGGAELGKTLKFWLDLVVDVTDSHDLIEKNGDGDWQGVAERLAEMKPTTPAETTGGAR